MIKNIACNDVAIITKRYVAEYPHVCYFLNFQCIKNNNKEKEKNKTKKKTKRKETKKKKRKNKK